MNETFRRVVAEKVGEGVLYSGDIDPIVRNLGATTVTSIGRRAGALPVSGIDDTNPSWDNAARTRE